MKIGYLKQLLYCFYGREALRYTLNDVPFTLASAFLGSSPLNATLEKKFSS